MENKFYSNTIVLYSFGLLLKQCKVFKDFLEPQGTTNECKFNTWEKTFLYTQIFSTCWQVESLFLPGNGR